MVHLQVVCMFDLSLSMFVLGTYLDYFDGIPVILRSIEFLQLRGRLQSSWNSVLRSD